MFCPFNFPRRFSHVCSQQPLAVPPPYAAIQPPPLPRPHAATRQTTGHRAGASLHGSEWDTLPDQYLCISCPFAQVSSLIITVRWSFNELAGRTAGRAGVTFPHAWAELDRLQRHRVGGRQHRWHYSCLCRVESNTPKPIFKMLPAVSISKSG